MLLVVDVGNTQTHLGTFEGETLVEHWRFATVRESTADELGATLRNLLALRNLTFDDLTASIVSSTVPQLEPEWTAMGGRYLGHETLTVGPGLRTGMPIRFDNPREVGADRLVNAVGAHGRYPGGALIVLDFGTATTFDVVAEDGAYCGGVIAPGINLSLEALHRAAAKLPRVAVARPQAVIGRNTVAAIQSGIFWGYVGLIEGLVARLRAEFERPMTTVATGGLAHLFGGATAAIEHVDPDLTMAGLVEIYGKQKPLLGR